MGLLELAVGVVRLLRPFPSALVSGHSMNPQRRGNNTRQLKDLHVL